jgi:hypothetical protein
VTKQPKAFSPSGYYQLRLEHTLRHTQQATRLIYLVDAGFVGALYFAAQMKELALHRGYVIVAVLVTLMLINFLHAMLLKRLGQCYSALDTEFARESGAIKVVLPKVCGIGLHDLHAAIHIVVALALAFAQIVTFLQKEILSGV